MSPLGFGINLKEKGSRMKQTICDICGQKVKERAYKIGFKPVLLCRTSYAYDYGMIDICDNCVEAIKKTIKEKQNERKNN